MTAARIVLIALLAGLALSMHVFARARRDTRDQRRSEAVVARERVGPGTVLMRIRELGRAGPVEALVLRVDLNDANPGYAPMLAPDGIGLFTPAWGIYERYGAVRGLRSVTEVLVRHGHVARVSHRAGAGPIPSGGFVLLGAGSGGRRLAHIRVGDSVTVRYAQRTAAPAPFRFALGGKYRLLRAGVVQSGLPVAPGAERTGLGFSDGGRIMWLVVTESHEIGAAGLDLPQLAMFMRSLGVRDAIDLDDGGSTTIVSRLRLSGELKLLNRPADGHERRVANGVGLFSTEAGARGPRVEARRRGVV